MYHTLSGVTFMQPELPYKLVVRKASVFWAVSCRREEELALFGLND